MPGSSAAAFALVALALCGAALAAEHPKLAPTHDVVVDYAFSARNDDAGAADAISMRFTIAAGGALVRIDQPLNTGFVVLDRGSDRTLVVLRAAHGYFELPYDPQRRFGFLLTDRMEFVRGATDTVAGIPCTEWQVRDGAVNGTACISADGVLLRGATAASGKRPGIMMRATAVSYAAQPPSVFQPPPGYRRLDRGAGMSQP